MRTGHSFSKHDATAIAYLHNKQLPTYYMIVNKEFVGVGCQM